MTLYSKPAILVRAVILATFAITYQPPLHAQTRIKVEIEHISIEQMQKLIDGFSSSTKAALAKTIKKTQAQNSFKHPSDSNVLTTLSCENKKVCPVTLSITYDKESDTCAIIPVPYRYEIKNRAIITWKIDSPGFYFDKDDPVLFNYKSPYDNDPEKDIFHPTFLLSDKFALTADIHASANKEIHYDFQIERDNPGKQHTPCKLSDPVIYNM